MYVLRLARLGQTMEEGVVMNWLKGENEPFAIGDEIFEVTTEKAAIAVEASRPGRFVRFLAELGDPVPVGAALALIAEPGEEPSAADIAVAAKQAQDAPLPEDASEPEPAPVAATTAAPAAPRPAGGKISAVPAARRLAAELGVDLAGLTGSGPDGTITVADVRRAAP